MKRLLATCAILALFAIPAAAAEGKIGYVDLQKALNNSAAGQAAKEKIAAKVQGYEGEIESRQAELKKLKDELEKQAMLLSEEARAAKERDYQQKLKDFQRFTKDIQEELQQQDADYTRQILEALLEVVKEVGEAQGFGMVLEKTESSLLYARPELNLTDQVIEAYNARYRKKQNP